MKVVGFNGLMPVRVKTEAGVMDAAWSCDFVVDAAHRRSGVGRLLKAALDHQAPLIMAKGTSQSAAQVLPRCGWVEGQGPRQFVLFMRPLDLRYRIVALLQGIARIGFRVAAPKGSAGTTIERSEQLPPAGELDELWTEYAAGYAKTVIRDSAYVTWRYHDGPCSGYRYYAARHAGRLRALLVVREDGEGTRIVDYVGPARALELKYALVDAVRNDSHGQERLNLVTTDREFQTVFRRLGAWPTRGGATGFFVRDPGGTVARPAEDWFLMDGDSDGEMLAMARESAPSLELREMEEEALESCREAWERLRAAGGYDGLFMSWTWQSCWWRHFGYANGAKAYFLEAVTTDNSTVAIVPMIEWAARARRFWPTRRLQLLGHMFQGPAAMRTEYLDLLVDPAWREPVAQKLAAAILARKEWEEFVIQDAPMNSSSMGTLVAALSRACYLRDLTEPGIDETRCVRTDVDFQTYLKTLGRGTRRALYHGRRRLDELGDVTLRDVGEEEVVHGLDLLNALHSVRWGQPVFAGERLRFHREIATEAAKAGRLKLSLLEVNGSPVSVVYDLVAGDRRYNLQQGFNSELEGFKGSLGLIHFGYAIEACCTDPEIRAYDLLAGGGKHELYKVRLGTEPSLLRNVQLIRGRGRKLLYSSYDRLKRHPGDNR